jgi:hypothetical protein
MSRAFFIASVRHAVVVAAMVGLGPAFAVAQATSAAAPPAPPQAATAMPREEIAAFAKVHLAVAQARDSIQLQLAQPGNKKPEAQKQLQEKLYAQVAEILHHAGMTQQEFDRKTYLVSTDAATRLAFDTVIAQLTGQPTPGQVMATAATARPAAPLWPCRPVLLVFTSDTWSTPSVTRPTVKACSLPPWPRRALRSSMRVSRPETRRVSTP